MSKVDYGEDNDYAETRIRGSILKTVYDSVVFVECFDYDEHKFVCNDILNKVQVLLDLDELVMDPVELGFINHTQSAAYTTRMPKRHYKQGLTSQTSHKHNFVFDLVKFGSVDMAKCILGIYPKLIDCVEAVFTGEAKSRGFSRNFSIESVDGSNTLNFRGNTVGEVLFNSDNGLLQNRLDKKYNFLQEMLEYETSV